MFWFSCEINVVYFWVFIFSRKDVTKHLCFICRKTIIRQGLEAFILSNFRDSKQDCYHACFPSYSERLMKPKSLILLKPPCYHDELRFSIRKTDCSSPVLYPCLAHKKVQKLALPLSQPSGKRSVMCPKICQQRNLFSPIWFITLVKKVFAWFWNHILTVLQIENRGAFWF